MTPYMMEYNSNVDRLFASAIPGAAYGLGAPAHDVLSGEPITNPSGGLNAVLPFKIVKRGTDPVRDALEDIEFDSSIIAKTIKDVDLKPEHISRLQQLLGESGMYNDLKSWVVSPRFQAAIDRYKEDLKNGKAVKKENYRFYSGVNKIKASRYRDQAINQLLVEFPELSEEIRAFRQAKDEAGANSMDLLDFPLN